LTVFALDFRQGPQFKYPAASQDICAAVRFVRSNAHALGMDAERLGLMGGSSGGQLALLSALTPDAPHHTGTPIVDLGGGPVDAAAVNARVSFVAALWPVSDPLRRYLCAKSVGLEHLIESHGHYYEDEAQMHAASIQRSLDDGQAQSLPAVWVASPVPTQTCHRP
jgi:acetyl esterase/lipase